MSNFLYSLIFNNHFLSIYFKVVEKVRSLVYTKGKKKKKEFSALNNLSGGTTFKKQNNLCTKGLSAHKEDLCQHLSYLCNAQKDSKKYIPTNSFDIFS